MTELVNQQTRRSVQRFALGVLVLCGVASVSVGLSGVEPERFIHSLLMMVLVGLAATLLSTPIRFRTWAVLLTGCTTAVVVPLALYEDASGNVLWWVALPVIATSLVGDRRGNRIAALLGVVGVLAYFAALQVDLTGVAERPLRPVWHRGFNAVAFMVAIYAFGEFTARSFAAIRQDMQQTLTRLEEEVAEHRATQLELSAAHRQVIETARVAGMAEVATGVLHNVGNALNTVVVTSQVVRDRVSDVAMERRLERLAELLRNEETDPELLVRYVEAMHRQSTNERMRTTSEMDRLRDAVSHVSQVVSAQQAHARSRGVVEDVTPSGLLDEVVRLSQPVTERHGVHVTLEVHHDVSITTERHQVVQVLENLVRNAAEALAQQPTRRQIALIARSENGFLRLTVRDNGPGIPADARERVFQHGFTTKASGSGFGLHVSALASKSVGGRLDLDDDATDGTSFSLWLPMRRGAPVPSLVPWDEMTDEHAQAS